MQIGKHLVVRALGQQQVAVPAHAVDVVAVHPACRIHGRLHNRAAEPIYECKYIIYKYECKYVVYMSVCTIALRNLYMNVNIMEPTPCTALAALLQPPAE